MWLKVVRQGGLEALLERAKPGPKEGTCRGIESAIIDELKAKLEANEFVTVEDARRWLKKAHAIERPYGSVWNWLKKFAGVLRVPRPRHSKKDPEAEQAFKERLSDKLEALRIETGQRNPSRVHHG